MLRERKTSICRRSLIGLLLGILAVGCQQSPTGPEAENERVVREALDAIDHLDFDRLSELFAEDFVLRFVGSSDRVGREVTFELIRGAYASFPDQTHIIDEVITEGDRVVVRLSYEGSHQGEYDGIAPTGNRFDYAGIQIYTVVDGVAKDVWILDDGLTFMSQLGMELAPAPDVERKAVGLERESESKIGIRRVVTGHDDGAKAVFASDERVQPITLALLPGTEFFRLWGADIPPEFPDDGSAQASDAYFPPVGGFRFGLFTVAPDSVTMVEDLDMEAAFRELDEKLPGIAEYFEADNPGMHRTATIDYEYVVSGRCVLELDDGATRELGPGDTVIQNGTRHAWRNPYEDPCVMVVVLIGVQNDLVATAEQ